MNRIYISIIIISFFASCNICENFLDNEISPQNFSGKVTEKYEEEDCFGGITLESKDTLQSMPSINYCVPNGESLWDAVQVGDSIYKPSGSIIVTVQKKDTVIKFEYPCVVQ